MGKTDLCGVGVTAKTEKIENILRKYVRTIEEEEEVQYELFMRRWAKISSDFSDCLEIIHEVNAITKDEKYNIRIGESFVRRGFYGGHEPVYIDDMKKGELKYIIKSLCETIYAKINLTKRHIEISKHIANFEFNKILDFCENNECDVDNICGYSAEELLCLLEELEDKLKVYKKLRVDAIKSIQKCMDIWANYTKGMNGKIFLSGDFYVLHGDNRVFIKYCGEEKIVDISKFYITVFVDFFFVDIPSFIEEKKTYIEKMKKETSKNQKNGSNEL